MTRWVEYPDDACVRVCHQEGCFDIAQWFYEGPDADDEDCAAYCDQHMPSQGLPRYCRDPD